MPCTMWDHGVLCWVGATASPGLMWHSHSWCCCTATTPGLLRSEPRPHARLRNWNASAVNRKKPAYESRYELSHPLLLFSFFCFVCCFVLFPPSVAACVALMSVRCMCVWGACVFVVRVCVCVYVCVCGVCLCLCVFVFVRARSHAPSWLARAWRRGSNPRTTN